MKKTSKNSFIPCFLIATLLTIGIGVFFCGCGQNNSDNSIRDSSASGDNNDDDKLDTSDTDDNNTCKFNSDCPEGYICNDDMVCVEYEKPEPDDDDSTIDDDDNDNDTTTSKCTVRFNCPSEPWWDVSSGYDDSRLNGLETVTDYPDKIKACNNEYKSMLAPGEIAVDLSLMSKLKWPNSFVFGNNVYLQTIDYDRMKCFPKNYINRTWKCEAEANIIVNLKTKRITTVNNYGGTGGNFAVVGDDFYNYFDFNGKENQCQSYAPLAITNISETSILPKIQYDFIFGIEGGHEIVSGDGVVAVRGWYKEEPSWQTEKIYIYDPLKPEAGFKPIINTRDYAPDWPLLMHQIHEGWLNFGGFGDDLYYVDYKNPENKRNIMEEYKKFKGEKLSDYVLLETDGYKIIWGEKYKLNEDDLYSKTDLILFEIPATPSDNSGYKLQNLTEDINAKLGRPFRIGATAIKGVWVGFCEYEPDSFKDRYSDVYAYNLETKELYSFGRKDTVYIQMAKNHLCYIDERRTKSENPLYLEGFTHDELTAIICIDLQSPEMEQYKVK